MSCLPAHDLGRDSGAKYDLHGPKVSPCFPWNDGSEEHCLSWFVIIISSHLTSVLTVDEPMNTSRLLSQRRATTPHLVLITWYPGSFIPPCAVSYLASMILLINLDEAVVTASGVDEESFRCPWVHDWCMRSWWGPHNSSAPNPDNCTVQRWTVPKSEWASSAQKLRPSEYSFWLN